MNSNINVKKHEDGEEQVQKSSKNNTSILKMQERIGIFCNKLLDDEEHFDVTKTMEYLMKYLHEYHRILYSEFSNRIYAYYEEHSLDDASEAVGTMLSHMEKLIDYVQTTEFETKKQGAHSIKDYEDASKAVIKIWDHINLAQQQYTMLKMSDEEYRRKIDDRLTPFQKDLSKELNAQLLTMIGIFTALAFLLFGGISSLENLFANASMPTLKFVVVGSTWGLCLLNLLYIFLLCVGKMSNLTFGLEKENLTIFQRYAIVWWSDFILGSFMIFSLWGYYLQKNDSYEWFNNIFLEHSSVFTIALICIFLKFGWELFKATRINEK